MMMQTVGSFRALALLLFVGVGCFRFPAWASEESHWAFQPLLVPEVPKVQQLSWPRNSIDYFILFELEKRNLRPGGSASKSDLIRRAYLDLIGIPPAASNVQAFLADERPDAFARLVNQLLASPHYGERWGRHWLDVARYGDSNGGDENHAYPHAHRYRDYVIDAFNRDLPYDRFLTEQLAGDLMGEPGSGDEMVRRIKGTGFLAIGTKVLAEQDPVKKRADIVDEQIDTVGKAFLGLTLACARCHDHKFDPIPTRDYYALAGIFHSTAIETRALETEAYQASTNAIQAEIDQISRKIQDIESQMGFSTSGKGVREWEAEKFQRGNVIIDHETYGKGIGIISDPGSQENFAEYDLEIPVDGIFLLSLRYAAAKARPGRILLDGEVIRDPAVTEVTGGWMPEHQQWQREGFYSLAKGMHRLRLESKPLMSHIDKIKLVSVTNANLARETLTRLDTLRNKRQQLIQGLPRPPQAMAVLDRNVTDAPLHVRGDPHDHGERIPRGWLSRIGPGNRASRVIQTNSSGRLEFANWLTHPSHPLTSRVMVNRIWRWHFGTGLVGTPNNFGLKGQRPIHRDLLDHLATTFIHEKWSIKQLHRYIMASRTYQMATELDRADLIQADPDNRLFGRRNLIRMEAEVFRDAILQLSGSLNPSPAASVLQVKSQNPSPDDLVQNRKAYETFPHRSVYLPVVRTHTYDMLTLLDFPNASASVGHRTTTTVPTQALLMMNNPFLITQAKGIVQRLGFQSGAADQGVFTEALYRHVLGRPALANEKRWASRFLSDYAKLKGWDRARGALCQTLLMSDEFLYIW